MKSAWGIVVVRFISELGGFTAPGREAGISVPLLMLTKTRSLAASGGEQIKLGKLLLSGQTFCNIAGFYIGERDSKWGWLLSVSVLPCAG